MAQKITNDTNNKMSDINPNKFKLSEHHITLVQRANKFLYDKPFFKVPLFLGIAVLLFILFSVITPGNSSLVKLAKFFIYMFTTIYLLFFVIHLIGKSFKSLITANNIAILFLSYTLFMFSIILFFASAYDTVGGLNKGYLTYGTCSDKFEKSVMQADNQKSEDHFYFSAVTIFTVGYGDICPMGWNKTIAIINAFVGNFINVILMVLVISNYMDKKNPYNKN